MSKPYLYTRVDRKAHQNACIYYRVYVPIRMLDKVAGYHIYHDEMYDFKEGMEALLASDIAHFYSIVGPDFLHQIEVLKAMRGGRIGDGSFKLPPTIIWDCDDNHDFVHPLNATFCWMGVRAYPGIELLEPGESIEVELENGKRIKTWEDGVTKAEGHTFSVEQNLKNMKSRHQIIRAVHGVTCASKRLASYVRDVVGQKNVYFFPNTIIPEDYVSYPLIRPKEVRILWQGGMSHYVDWYPLRNAVKRISQKYPNVKWVMFGEKFNWVLDVIPEKQLEFIGWVPYAAYKTRRALVSADINLCPLVNNIFNISKSAIKWYEGSIWDVPEATLAQKTGAYADEIVDGETGLLFENEDEFVQKLSLLIEDAQLRARLGQAAKRWVLDNRTPEKTIPGLVEFHEECRAIRAREVIQLGASNSEINQLAEAQGLR